MKTIDSYLNNTATAGELRELGEDILADREVADEFVRATRQEAMLERVLDHEARVASMAFLFPAELPERSRVLQFPGWMQDRRRVGQVAAGLLVLGLLGYLFRPRPAETVVAKNETPTPARLRPPQPGTVHRREKLPQEDGQTAQLLARYYIPEAVFQEKKLGEVLETLGARYLEYAHPESGLEVPALKFIAPPVAAGAQEPVITLNAKDLPLLSVLRLVAAQADQKLTVTADSVVMVPLPAGALRHETDLLSRTYTGIPRGVLNEAAQKGDRPTYDLSPLRALGAWVSDWYGTFDQESMTLSFTKTLPPRLARVLDAAVEVLKRQDRNPVTLSSQFYRLPQARPWGNATLTHEQWVEARRNLATDTGATKLASAHATAFNGSAARMEKTTGRVAAWADNVSLSHAYGRGELRKLPLNRHPGLNTWQENGNGVATWARGDAVEYWGTLVSDVNGRVAAQNGEPAEITFASSFVQASPEPELTVEGQEEAQVRSVNEYAGADAAGLQVQNGDFNGAVLYGVNSARPLGEISNELIVDVGQNTAFPVTPSVPTNWSELVEFEPPEIPQNFASGVFSSFLTDAASAGRFVLNTQRRVSSFTTLGQSLEITPRREGLLVRVTGMLTQRALPKSDAAPVNPAQPVLTDGTELDLLMIPGQGGRIMVPDLENPAGQLCLLFSPATTQPLANPAAEELAQELREKPAQEFKFDRAHLGAVVEKLAAEAGLGLRAVSGGPTTMVTGFDITLESFMLPLEEESGNVIESKEPVTFSETASPFAALEHLAQANGLTLDYDPADGFWTVTRDQEVVPMASEPAATQK